MRSLLPQLLVLALSLVRAVLSSDDPSCDWLKAAREKEGLTGRRRRRVSVYEIVLDLSTKINKGLNPAADEAC